jgi:hypothetical protein
LPDSDGDSRQIVEKFTEHGDAIALLVGWVAANLVLLAFFLAGVHDQARSGDPVLARMGSIGGTMLIVFFPLVNFPLVILAIGADRLGTTPGVVEALWQLHLVAFAFSGISLGIALLGLSLATVRATIAPRWFGIVGPVGAAVIILGSIPVKAVAEGSDKLMFSLLGFVTWLVFLAVVGVKMWRADSYRMPASVARSAASLS